MRSEICVIPGDGIGPEVVDAAMQIVSHFDDSISFKVVHAGLEEYQRSGTNLSDETLSILDDSPIVFCGAFSSSPSANGKPLFRSTVLTIRRHLSLFANVRPAQSIHPLSLSKFDLLIVRENTEGTYNQKEWHLEDENVCMGERRASRDTTQRIAKYAYQLAEEYHKNKITIVTKANILPVVDGYFRSVAEETLNSLNQQSSRKVLIEHEFVDAAAYKLVKCPEQFDILLTMNLYGDILSDVMAGMLGSLGLCSSMCVGERHLLFEPVHGSAPDLAGKGIANPMASIYSMCMLLDKLGKKLLAQKLRIGMCELVKSNCRTPDIGGSETTSSFAQRLISYVSDLEQ